MSANAKRRHQADRVALRDWLQILTGRAPSEAEIEIEAARIERRRPDRAVISAHLAATLGRVPSPGELAAAIALLGPRVARGRPRKPQSTRPLKELNPSLNERGAAAFAAAQDMSEPLIAYSDPECLLAWSDYCVERATHSEAASCDAVARKRNISSGHVSKIATAFKKQQAKMFAEHFRLLTREGKNRDGTIRKEISSEDALKATAKCFGFGSGATADFSTLKRLLREQGIEGLDEIALKSKRAALW